MTPPNGPVNSAKTTKPVTAFAERTWLVGDQMLTSIYHRLSELSLLFAHLIRHLPNQGILTSPTPQLWGDPQQII